MTSPNYYSLAATVLAALARPSIGQKSRSTPANEIVPHKAANETVPHQGCLLLLQADHTPMSLLVGAAFESTAAASGYRVTDEAGPTAAACADGLAGAYPCSNVDLLSAIPLEDLCWLDPATTCAIANDLWGWTHAATGREFALIGNGAGTSFVEITDPYHPVYLGWLETTGLEGSAWRTSRPWATTP